MTMTQFRGGRSARSGGLLLFLAASCAMLACDRKNPVDPDPRPSFPSWLVVVRHINDSTLAYDLTLSDTALLTHVVNFIEGAAPETIRFSPRYNLRHSDTLQSRPPGRYYSWYVLAAGDDPPPHRIYESDHTDWIGPLAPSLAVAGIPDVVPHVGLDLTLQLRGPNPFRSVLAYVDSGTAGALTYMPVAADSGVFTTNTINPDVHLWITGPLANGPHSLTLVARDSTGQYAYFRKNIVTAIPSQTYRVTSIDAPGAIDVVANDINNDGAIAVTALLADTTTRAMRWSGGILESLGGPLSSAATAINGAGDVAGYVGRLRGTSGSGSPSDSMVVWHGAQPQAFAVGYGFRRAEAIANDGSTLVENTLYRGGQATALGLVYAFDMNNSATVAGQTLDYFSEQAVVVGPLGGHQLPLPYQIQGFPRAPHCCGAAALFINDAGRTIGTYEGAFFIVDGTTPAWTANPLGRGTVKGMSRGNLVLAQLSDGSIAVWTIGGPTTRVVLNTTDWTIDDLRGINDRAQIIAHGVNKATGRKAALLLDPM
jgi:hypothetical protein